MSYFDEIYNGLVTDIKENGTWDKGQDVRTKYADGTSAYTKSVFGRQIIIPSDVLPIITTKKVGYKSALRELYWIWFMKSNKVKDLQDMKCSIWDEWEQEDGTIGEAYGFQLAKMVHNINGVMLDQVDNLLFQLENNPSSRRHIVNLWDIDDLSKMSLTPCVWSTQWDIRDNKLNLLVNQRSCDIALGFLFNAFQYKILLINVLLHLNNTEKHKDLRLGDVIWNFGNLHYYDRHEELLLEQIKGETHEQPVLGFSCKYENFYDFHPDDITVLDYKHNGKFEYEVAI